MKRFVLMPAGKKTRELMECTIKKECECVCVCDNNSDMVGKKIHGVKITKPDVLKDIEFEKIIICSGKPDCADQIKEQLIDMGIESSKIYCTWGVDSSKLCQTVLDDYFLIEKQETVPFEMKSAKIYQNYAGETLKSRGRREAEGFYAKYIRGIGIDIGYGADVIAKDCCGWDIMNGDAQYMDGIEDEVFDYVYSSHCLEHVCYVRTAIKNWFRILKRGGYLIIVVPDRNLYEKKKMLPSRWNMDHKHMFLLGQKDEIDTLDIMEEIRESITGYTIIYAKTCDYGHTINDPLIHSDGEYQIEVVVRKDS